MSRPTQTTEPKWIALGHPSYVWRAGQDRRLNLVCRHVDLTGRRILDVGCGIGTYVRKFREFSPAVFGVDVDEERAGKAGQTLPNVLAAVGEALPFASDSFDMVFLHEVIEHVRDDRQTLAEAVRVTRPGGSVVVFAPNRLYPFETHGIYVSRRFIFGVIPFVNYLPDPLRNRLCPHARAYTWRGLQRLVKGLDVETTVHTYVYPGFDNIASRRAVLAKALRRVFYFAENTPLRALGLSHFWVVKKLESSARCVPQKP